MDISPDTHIRVARPSRDLAAAERFYVDGLGLEILHRADGGHQFGPDDLVMVGLRGAAWHFELAYDPEKPVEPAPTEEDLFVLYLGAPVSDALVERLENAGGKRVVARNPYWDEYGVTIEDPDGYRLVLCARPWAGSR